MTRDDLSLSLSK